MEASDIRIKPLLISIATIVFIELAFIELASSFVVSRTPYGAMWVLGAVRLLEVCALVLIVTVWGKGLSSIGLAPSKMVSGFRKGMIWSAVFGLFTLFAFVALYLLDIDPFTLIHTPVPSKTCEVVLFFIVGGLVGPIAEEVFFRGVLYGFFRRWGILIALILSSALFVLAHLPGIPLTQLVGAVVFALAYEKAGSLTAPITIHVLGNMAIFTLSLIVSQP